MAAPVFIYKPPAAQGRKPSLTQNAVIQRLLALKQGAPYRSIRTWLQIAARWNIDAADLVVATIATNTPPGGIGELAKKIRDNIGAPGIDGSLQAWLDKTYPQAAVNVLGVYKSVKAGGYVPRYGQAPLDAAKKTIEQTAAKQQLTDPWVVLKKGKNGKLGVVTVNSAQPPKDAISSFGTPITKSQFDKAWSDYNDYFTAYSGRPATPIQVANIIKKGLSSYAVEQMLSDPKQNPNFMRSRVWASKAPSVIGYAKSLYGEGWKVDRDLVRRAIVQNWDQGTLDRKLKERPEYLKGPQYKQATAALSNVHMKIMGTPGPQDQVNLHEAALEGWSPDQYAAWVRSTKEYQYSPEAKNYSIQIAQALGLITGSQGLVPVNAPGGAPQPAQENKLPNSSRVPGVPTPNVPPPVKPPAGKAKPKQKAPVLRGPYG